MSSGQLDAVLLQVLTCNQSTWTRAAAVHQLLPWLAGLQPAPRKQQLQLCRALVHMPVQNCQKAPLTASLVGMRLAWRQGVLQGRALGHMTQQELSQPLQPGPWVQGRSRAQTQQVSAALAD